MREVIQAVQNKDLEALKRLLPISQESSASERPSCPICNDSGWVEVPEEAHEGYKPPCRPCQCVLARQAKRRMEASGLGVTLDRCTFDNFRVEAPWQKNMRDTAWAYVENHGSDWLYMGGQPGCGKTHLCTAVCGALLNRGVPVRYMLWADQVQRIKAGINDSDVLDELLEPLKTIPVLYIDDLFKSQNTNGKPSPTPADVRLAFEIFNARYVRGLPTIISCEWDLMDLLDTDQGTFSRVYERCKRFCVQVSADRARNYRLNGG